MANTAVIVWPREKTTHYIKPKSWALLSYCGGGGWYPRYNHDVRWREDESFMPWFTIGVQMLSFEERQEMFGPCQVGRPARKFRLVNHYATRRRIRRFVLSLPGRILTNVETTEQVSKGEVKFTIRQATRQRLIPFISGTNPRKFFSAYFMPRQLRGPFEKLTSQASRALESGWSHRSGINSYGREKISSENETKTTLWLTTLCQELSGMTDNRQM